MACAENWSPFSKATRPTRLLRCEGRETGARRGGGNGTCGTSSSSVLRSRLNCNNERVISKKKSSKAKRQIRNSCRYRTYTTSKIISSHTRLSYPQSIIIIIISARLQYIFSLLLKKFTPCFRSVYIKKNSKTLVIHNCENTLNSNTQTQSSNQGPETSRLNFRKIQELG